jgi:hypothetical protein
MARDLVRRFAAIGARARVGTVTGGPVALDIQRDGRGELFDIRLPVGTDTAILDTRRGERHLVMLVGERRDRGRFLCGHDERHWFVAAIPESAGVTTVAQAREALQPAPVRQAAAGLRRRLRQRRRNPAFVRQGEWFFLPVSGDLRPDVVLRNEPLRREPASRAHVVEFAHRRGGATVHVSRAHPAGLTQREFEDLPEPERRRHFWSQMRRGPAVFARGRVRHPDHATIELPGWHEVLMNTEHEAAAMRHLAVFDGAVGHAATSPGVGERTRTSTPSRAPDPKSGASASSATPTCRPGYGPQLSTAHPSRPPQESARVTSTRVP